MGLMSKGWEPSLRLTERAARELGGRLWSSIYALIVELFLMSVTGHFDLG